MKERASERTNGDAGEKEEVQIDGQRRFEIFAANPLPTLFPKRRRQMDIGVSFNRATRESRHRVRRIIVGRNTTESNVSPALHRSALLATCNPLSGSESEMRAKTFVQFPSSLRSALNA